MAKKGKPLGGDLGFNVLVQTMRFSFAWTERFLKLLFQNVKFIFSNFKNWNNEFDDWTTTQFQQVMVMPLKIGIIITLSYFLGFYILILFLGYLILKSL